MLKFNPFTNRLDYFESSFWDLETSTSIVPKNSYKPRFPSDIGFGFGGTAGSPLTQLLWETADANANSLLLSLPEGGAVNVPVFVIGDETALNKDLGLFNGFTNPTLAILNDDATKAIYFQHDGTDGTIGVTSGTLNLPASVVVDGVALKTTADVDYYISTTGSDVTGDGTIGNPWLTRQYVYDLIPDVVAHKVTIHLAAGTYYDGAILRGHFVSTDGSIVIQGATTTILASQTATGGDNFNADGLGETTVAGAGWGVNAYAGYFIRFTTSTSPTEKIYIKYAPIISNTADTLVTPALRFSPTASTTFDIVRLDTTISGATAASPNKASHAPEKVTNMQAASSALDDGLYARYAITYDALTFQNGPSPYDVYVTEAWVMLAGCHFASTDPTASANYWAVYAYSSNNYVWIQGCWMDGYKHALLVSQEAAIVTAECVYLDYRGLTSTFTAGAWDDIALTLTKVGAFAGLSLHGTFPLNITSGTNMVVNASASPYTATYVSDDVVTLVAAAGSANSADVAFQLGSSAYDDVAQTAAGGSAYLRSMYVRGDATHVLTKVMNADGNGSYGDLGAGRIEYATSIMRAGSGGYVNAFSNNSIIGANNTNLYTVTSSGAGKIRSQTGAGYSTAYNVDDSAILFYQGTAYLSPDTAANWYVVRNLIHPQTVVAASAIPLGYSIDSLTAAGAITLTSTPTIQAGVYTGQPMTLVGTSDVNTITLQDEAVAAGTTLELLNNATVTLGAGDAVNFKWNASTSKWEEAGNTFMNMLFKGTTGNKNIYLQDNQADTLSFTEGTNKYLTFKTTNTAEEIQFLKDVGTTGHIFVSDDKSLKFGNTTIVPDVSLGWNTTQTVDGLFLGLADGQNTFIIAEEGDKAYDFGHGVQTNPHLFIHSSNQTQNQWISFFHNGSNGVIATGEGSVLVTPYAGYGLTVTQTAAVAGSAVFSITGAANTALTAATEFFGANLNLSATKTWAAGAGPLANQREVIIQAPTYSGDAGGALTIADAYTFYVNGGPVQGSNLTITRSWAAGFLGNVAFADGTAALPSISFGLDPNTGIYRVGADQIGFSVNGAVELTLNATNFSPGIDNGIALGVSGTAFSSLFLASGAVINWNAGDITLTHSTDVLTISGGIFSHNTVQRSTTTDGPWANNVEFGMRTKISPTATTASTIITSFFAMNAYVDLTAPASLQVYAIVATTNLTNTVVGTIAEMGGLLIQNNCEASTTVTDNHSIRIQNPSNAGTITNNYGIYIDAQTSGSTINRAIEIAGTGGIISWSAGNATITHSTGLLTSNVDIAVPDEVYGIGWNASVEVPTKNALYDKIEVLQPLDTTLTAFASYNSNGLLTQTAADTFTGRTIVGTTEEVVVSNGDGVAGNPTISLSANSRQGTISFLIDGGGSAITVGQKGHIEMNFRCTITGWTVLADQSGSIVVDVWKDTYGNFPPTVADSIAGTEKPTLTAAQKNQDLSLSSWTTTVANGDILAFNVDSAATVTRVLVSIQYIKD